MSNDDQIIQAPQVWRSRSSVDGFREVVVMSTERAVNDGARNGMVRVQGQRRSTMRASTLRRDYVLVRNADGTPAPETPARIRKILGHGLKFEGAPHDANGHRITIGRWPGVGGEGRAACACGTLSDVLPSAYTRRKWRRAHKAAL